MPTIAFRSKLQPEQAERAWTHRALVTHFVWLGASAQTMTLSHSLLTNISLRTRSFCPSLLTSCDESCLPLFTSPPRVFQVQAQLEKVRAELDMQSQHTARLESSCRALERSLGQSGKRLQVRLEPTAHHLRLFCFSTPLNHAGLEFQAPSAVPTDVGGMLKEFDLRYMLIKSWSTFGTAACSKIQFSAHRWIHRSLSSLSCGQRSRV